MPQLSPASWLLLPVSFYLSIALVMSLLWWHQSPNLTLSSPKFPALPLHWNWSW